MLVTVKITE